MAPVSAGVCAGVQRRRGARPWHTWAIVCGQCLGVAEGSWGPEGGQDGDRHSWKSGRCGARQGRHRGARCRRDAGVIIVCDGLSRC